MLVLPGDVQSGSFVDVFLPKQGLPEVLINYPLGNCCVLCHACLVEHRLHLIIELKRKRLVLLKNLNDLQILALSNQLKQLVNLVLYKTAVVHQAITEVLRQFSSAVNAYQLVKIADDTPLRILPKQSGLIRANVVNACELIELVVHWLVVE